MTLIHNYITYIFISFIASMLCGLFAIPVIIKFCRKKNLYDLPNARKVHKNMIPRLGGICFMPSMVLSFILTIFFFYRYESNRSLEISVWSIYFFVSLALIYGTGLIDDILGLGPKTKFCIQIIAASLLPAAGLYINNLYGFMGIYEIPSWVGMPITVFLIVFIDNAMNLIDGIDGLSSGLSIVALAGFLICFYKEGIWIYSILISAFMGVLTAFLCFNLFGSPEKGTKIFMGDSGSLTIGFILGFLFVKFSMDNPNVMPFRKDSIMLSYTLLIVPSFDVCRVIIARLWHRKPIFMADKNHLHHLVMRTGLNQRQTLFVIMCMSLFFIALNILLAMVFNYTMIVLADIIVWGLLYVLLGHFIKRNNMPIFLTEN